MKAQIYNGEIKWLKWPKGKKSIKGDGCVIHRIALDSHPLRLEWRRGAYRAPKK